MLDKSYILWHFQADECVCFVRLSQSSAATAAGRKYAHKLKEIKINNIQGEDRLDRRGSLLDTVLLCPLLPLPCLAVTLTLYEKPHFTSIKVSQNSQNALKPDLAAI